MKSHIFHVWIIYYLRFFQSPYPLLAMSLSMLGVALILLGLPPASLYVAWVKLLGGCVESWGAFGVARLSSKKRVEELC